MSNVDKLVIKVEQRNGRKAWTSIEHLELLDSDESNLKDLVKYIKKKLSCNGCLKKSKEDGTLYIQFQGKHAEEVQKILEAKELISSDKVVVVGDY